MALMYVLAGSHFRKQVKRSITKTKFSKDWGGREWRGNHYDEETGEVYWVSGVKKRGSNTHWLEGGHVEVDEDAMEEYRKIKSS